MSVRTERLPESSIPSGQADALATISAAQQSDSTLSDANDFNIANPEHPLSRTIVVSVRASLDDLCLRKAKATWQPSAEALKQIFQQRRFTDLAGASEPSGDLKVRTCALPSFSLVPQSHERVLI